MMVVVMVMMVMMMRKVCGGEDGEGERKAHHRFQLWV